MTLKRITNTPFELPSETLKIQESNAEVVSFNRNEIIIEKGKVETAFYFIKSGLARIFYPPTEDNPKEDNLLFGEAGNVAASVSSFILGLPSIFSFAAVTKVTAYKIDSEIIRELYKNDLVFCRWLLELSLLQISYLEIRHTYLSAKDAYTRFLNFIKFKPKSFMRRVPAYHIASYLNVTPTTLSLMRKRYAHDEEHKVDYDKTFLDKVGITGEAPE